MVTGQDVLSPVLDVPALNAVEDRLVAWEAVRCQAHAEQLRAALDADRIHRAAGHELNAVPQVALVLRCSEHRARQLVADARVLAPLPGAIEAVECGLLPVESSRRLVDALEPLPGDQRLAVWKRLQAKLIEADARAAVLPPARLVELVRRWATEADPDGATARRREAESRRSVEYTRRPDDGLVDLLLQGLNGPDAQACLQSIRRHAAPHSSFDFRTADQRHLDAARDLLLGRSALPFGEQHCPPGCACRPGQSAPCGADLTVLVPLGAALGTTDEAAELVGHGPLEPDLLQRLLLASPVLHGVFVDKSGVPVASSPLVERPARDDPASLREALLRLAHSTPGPHQPRHLDDHPPPVQPVDRPHPSDPPASPRPDRPVVLTGAHPAGTPGPYRPPASLRRFLTVRSPRSEWPGSGVRASRCDLDHDLTWPFGPTCPCNLGPADRRHHRVKQLGWIKLRARDGSVRWTSPSGKTWTSPSPHHTPAAPLRPLPPLPRRSPLDELSPTALDDELWHLDPGNPLWDDPPAHQLRAHDREPHEVDPTPVDTRWTLDLDDPYAWLNLREPVGG
jgi:hypothetical protein